MPPESYSVRIPWHKGLGESQEASALGLGWASELQNWVPEPTSLRARVGWKNASTTSAPATRRNRGIGRFRASKPYDLPANVRERTDTAGSTSDTSNFATNGTTGNVYIAHVHARVDGGTFTSWTTPANWYKLGESTSEADAAGDQCSEAIFFLPDASSTTGATFSFSASGGASTIEVFLVEYSGVDQDQKTADSVGTNKGNLWPATPAVGATFEMDSGTGELASRSSMLFVSGFGMSGASGGSGSAYGTFTEGFAQEQVGLLSRSLMGVRYAESAATPHHKVTLTAGSSPATGSVNFASLVVALKAKEASSVTSYDKLIVADNDNSNSLDIFAIDRSNLAAGTWTNPEDVATTTRTAPVAFANGLGQVVYTHPDWSASRRWNGTTASEITDSPSGEFVVYYRNRFWVGGSMTQPTRLLLSKVNDPLAWDQEADFFEVGQDDGEELLDAVPFAGGLLIAKRSSLWFLSGQGGTETAIEQLTGGGGYPGRCICPTPYGAVIAGDDRVWLTDGATASEIQPPIEKNYSLSGDFVTTAYCRGAVYICDESDGSMWVYNIESGTWHTEAVNSATEGPAFIASDNGQLLYGPQTATTISLLAYRPIPGDRAHDASLSEVFNAKTPEWAPQEAHRAFTPRYIFLRGEQLNNGATSDTAPTLTAYFNGIEAEAGAMAIPGLPMDSAGTFRKRIDIGAMKDGAGVDSIQIELDHTCPSDGAALYNWNETMMIYDVGPTI